MRSPAALATQAFDEVFKGHVALAVALDKVMRAGNGKDAGVTTVYMTHNTVHQSQVILQAYGGDGCWVGAMKFEQSEYDLLISGEGESL